MGDAGEFPDIRGFVKHLCVVCLLPEDVREYMNRNVAEGIKSWASWSDWLREVGHEVRPEQIGNHYRRSHEPA